jgi:hypothetical protein
MGGTPIGAPIVGWVGQTFGARWTLVGGGLATLAGTVLAVVVFSRAQGLIGHRHATPAPEDGDPADRPVLDGAPGRIAAGRS